MTLLSTLAPLGAAFLFFFYLGALLMRLVLVQVVERWPARWCFSSAVALATLLMALVLQQPQTAELHTRLPSHARANERHEQYSLSNHNNYNTHTSRSSMVMLVLTAMVLHVAIVCPMLLIGFVVHDAVARQRRALEGRAGGGSTFRQNLRAWCLALRSLLLRLLMVVLAFAAVLWLLRRGWRERRRVKGGGAGDASGLSLSAPIWLVGRWLRRLLAGSTTPLSSARAPYSTSAAPVASALPHTAYRPPYDDAMIRTGVATFFLAGVVHSIGRLGVVVMGLLAGYAAVMTPYALVAPRLFWRGQQFALRQTLQHLAQRQRYVLAQEAQARAALAESDYLARRAQAAPRANERGDADNGSRSHTGGGPAACAASSGAGRPWRWVRGIASAARTALPLRRSHTRSRSAVLAECAGMEYFATSLFVRAHRADALLEVAERGGTWSGTSAALMGALAALYTLLRVAATAVVLLWMPALAAAGNGAEDALGLLIAHLVDDGGKAPGASTGVRAASGLLSAWMIAVSVRSLLLLVFQLTRSIRAAVVTPDTTAVVLAMFMTVYFLGQLVLLPEAAAVLGPLPQRALMQGYDGGFVAGVGVTLFVQIAVVGDPVHSATA